MASIFSTGVHANVSKTPSKFEDMYSSSYILHPNLKHRNPEVVAGKGIYITLETGQRILDATGGPAVACLGHGNTNVGIAVARQMEKFSFCHSLSWSNAAAEDLANELILSTGEVMARCIFLGSGSEATDAAPKLARQYFVSVGMPDRTRFIARKGSFHGSTLGALAITDKPGLRKPFERLLLTDHVSYVSTPNVYRDMDVGESVEAFVERLATELDNEFCHVGPTNVCALVAETVPGSSIKSLGCLTAPPGYFSAIRSVCDKHGALLILDEIICGMGRTGTYHAWQQEEVKPDIQTVAKGLGGGYAPIASLLMSQKIVDGLELGDGFFNHGHTYQSHLVACAAALEVQKIIKRDHLLDNVVAMGARLQSGLQAALSHHPHVGNIRGRGLFWAIEFVKNKETKDPFPAKEGISRRVRATGLHGTLGDHVLITPSYSVSAEDIDLIVNKVAAVIKEVLG